MLDPKVLHVLEDVSRRALGGHHCPIVEGLAPYFEPVDGGGKTSGDQEARWRTYNALSNGRKRGTEIDPHKADYVMNAGDPCGDRDRYPPPLPVPP